MHLYRVVGTVTLSRAHPTFHGASLKLAEHVGESLVGGSNPEPEQIVVWDELGASIDSILAVSDGAEAAQPFRPALKPVDAYNSAILDELHLDPNILKSLSKST